jgi:hypothetical protein
MKLTVEELRKSYNCQMEAHYKDGYITIFIDAFDCFMDTIEAQQQEIQQLKQENDKLHCQDCAAQTFEVACILQEYKEKNEQLQAQNGAMRESLKIAREAFRYFKEDMEEPTVNIDEAIAVIEAVEK